MNGKRYYVIFEPYKNTMRPRNINGEVVIYNSYDIAKEKAGMFETVGILNEKNLEYYRRLYDLK